MRRLTLVRHAPTAANAAGVFQGQLDVPALPVDEPERYRIPVASPFTIFTSPLSRATAAAAILFPGEPVTTDPRLMERSVGEWEGLDHATVRDRWPGAFRRRWVDPEAIPPGGESLREFQDRVASFLTGPLPVGDVYAVTHNGWIRMARLLVGELTRDELFAAEEPFLQQITIVVHSHLALEL